MYPCSEKKGFAVAAHDLHFVDVTSKGRVTVWLRLAKRVDVPMRAAHKRLTMCTVSAYNFLNRACALPGKVIVGVVPHS